MRQGRVQKSSLGKILLINPSIRSLVYVCQLVFNQHSTKSFNKSLSSNVMKKRFDQSMAIPSPNKIQIRGGVMYRNDQAVRSQLKFIRDKYQSTLKEIGDRCLLDNFQLF